MAHEDKWNVDDLAWALDDAHEADFKGLPSVVKRLADEAEPKNYGYISGDAASLPRDSKSLGRGWEFGGELGLGLPGDTRASISGYGVRYRSPDWNENRLKLLNFGVGKDFVDRSDPEKGPVDRGSLDFFYRKQPKTTPLLPGSTAGDVISGMPQSSRPMTVADFIQDNKPAGHGYFVGYRFPFSAR